MTKTKTKSKSAKLVRASEDTPAKSVIARSDDGTIQITLTVPYSSIKKNRRQALDVLGRDIVVPGFRKGKAPLDKVIGEIPEDTLIENTLGRLLPKLISEAIKEHKIKPAIYPKFELLKTVEGEDWQIRAVTCEILEVKLGDYKKVIAGASRAKSIWTPSSEKARNGKEEKELTREEKEQETIKTLLKTIKVRVPKILIDQETNSRLSSLLQRIEKLGLTLESYLASIKKDVQTLRSEYKEQARQAISLDILLNQIAERENIKVDEKEIDGAIEASSATPVLAKKLNTPEQRRIIESVLRRRAALDSLVSLV